MTKRTALTGFIVPHCKVYGNGYFSETSNDPDNFNIEFNKLRKKLYDKEVEKRKSEIQEIKYSKLIEDFKYITARFERRDGRIVIHRHPRVAKHLDTNQYIISARHPGIGYCKSYRNEQGMLMTYDDRYLIRRRKELNKTSSRFIIKNRNNNNYTIIRSRQS